MMDIEKRKSLLMAFGVGLDEMFVFKSEDSNRKLLIVRRTGIDKLESEMKCRFNYKSVTESSYKEGCNVTVVMTADTMYRADGDTPRVTQAIGSANPDTVRNFGASKASAFIADIAAKRAKHKCILRLADLSQHDIYSEDESDDFVIKKNDFTEAVKEANKKTKI
jgi:hypothetical protein